VVAAKTSNRVSTVQIKKKWGRCSDGGGRTKRREQSNMKDGREHGGKIQWMRERTEREEERKVADGECINEARRERAGT
jgi:hypothetical protein